MNLRQNLTQKQIQTLRQVLSPKMIQMLKTFHLPYTELLEDIEKKATDNVFIEIEKPDQLTLYNQPKPNTENYDKGIETFASTKSKNDSLYQHLVDQLSLLHLPEKDLEICTFMIDFLDDRGYFSDYLQTKQELIKKFNIKERKVTDYLKIIQSLEPEGVGARTLKECLLIQIEQQDFDDTRLKPLLIELAKNHLEDLSKDNYDKIGKALSIPRDGAEALCEYLKKNTNPNPGSNFFVSQNATPIIPSFETKIEDDKIVLNNLEEQKGIQISLSPKYMEILHDPSTDEKTKSFLQEKLESAKQLKENLEKRHENLNKLAEYIINHQKEFVYHGYLYLNPLLQKDIAEKLRINNSTVSRIVSSKYIITPHGTFSLKQLCPRNHFGKTSVRLKLLLKDYLEKYPHHSDEKISKELHKIGIKIARRTVTKYRLELGEESSFTRSSSNPQEPST